MLPVTILSGSLRTTDMSIDVNKTEDIIKAIQSFNARQIAVIIFIVISAVSFSFWVENRYAKIKEIEAKFQRSQQQLDSAHFLSLEMFSMLDDHQRKIIMEKLEFARQNRNKTTD